MLLSFNTIILCHMPYAILYYCLFNIFTYNMSFILLWVVRARPRVHPRYACKPCPQIVSFNTILLLYSCLLILFYYSILPWALLAFRYSTYCTLSYCIKYCLKTQLIYSYTHILCYMSYVVCLFNIFTY
jgi:hypothetical protein